MAKLSKVPKPLKSEVASACHEEPSSPASLLKAWFVQASSALLRAVSFSKPLIFMCESPENSLPLEGADDFTVPPCCTLESIFVDFSPSLVVLDGPIVRNVHLSILFDDRSSSILTASVQWTRQSRDNSARLSHQIASHSVYSTDPRD